MPVGASGVPGAIENLIPGMPFSPASWTPFPFASLYARMLTMPPLRAVSANEHVADAFETVSRNVSGMANEP